MITDARWQHDLTAALRVESLFSSMQLKIPSVEEAASLRPTYAESAHAVANIRSWRTYLPEACVSTMINDGWQWST
ncbi:MAG: hypothetical protein ACLQO1_23655 [Steroidobacteraceae bacterium]